MKKHVLPLLILVITMALSFSCGTHKAEGPEETFESFQAALSGKDFPAVWDMLSNKSHNDFDTHFFEKAKKEVQSLPKEKQKEENAVLGKTGEEISKMTTRDFFILLMEQTEAGEEFAKKASAEVAKVTVTGNTAKLSLKDQKDEVTLVKEGKFWKVEL